jgi:phthalate 4,5-dioxygenase
MLTREENELLTQVGPGAPMGQLVRRYWIPALLSSELPTRNGDPVRVRLLGQNFVAWRDRDGRVGLFDEYCMHRGATLTQARCEGDGLRCIYHGWKFAVDGEILDTPNYPRETVKERLRAPVYRVEEADDVIWVYLGPRDREPPLPRYAMLERPPDTRYVSRIVLDCNFVQSMEGVLDASHVPQLHQDFIRLWTSGGGVPDEDFLKMRAPETEVEETWFGFHGAFVSEVEGRPYARVYAFALPFFCVPNPGSIAFPVPIDDHHTSFVSSGVGNPDDPALHELILGSPRHYADGVFQGTADNHWHQDRSAMREGSFSGFDGVALADFSVTTGMGPVFDRRREHLVPADQLVIRMRRKLLDAARDLAAGIEPAMPGREELLRVQAGDGPLEDGAAWQTLVPGNMAPLVRSGGSTSSR